MTYRALAMFLGLVSSIAAGGVSLAAKPADWPTYLHDKARSGRQPVAGSIAGTPKIAATFELGASLVGPIGFYDLDADGVSEGLCLQNGVYSAQNRAGKMLWTSERFDSPALLGFVDLDGDQRREFLISAEPPQLVALSPADGRVLCRVPFDRRATSRVSHLLDCLEPGRKGQQYFGYVMLEDEKGEFAQGWVCYVVFDQGTEHGRILWSKDMHLGAYPKTLMGDTDGDGDLELIVQSHQQLSALDPATGNVVTHFNYGGRRNYGMIQSVNLDGEPGDELVVLTDDAYLHMEVLGLGKFPYVRWLYGLEPENNPNTRQSLFKALPTSVADLDGDGNLEIAYSRWLERGDGQWHAIVTGAWNNDLKLDLAGAAARGLEDLNADGIPELLVSREERTERAMPAAEQYQLDVYSLKGGTKTLLGSIQQSGAVEMVPHAGTLRQYGANGRLRPRLADTDGDGRAELFWLVGGQTTAYGLNDEGHLFVKPASNPAVAPDRALSSPLPPAQWTQLPSGHKTSIIAADLTGDGGAELLIEKQGALIALTSPDTPGGALRELWSFPGVMAMGWNSEWYPAIALDIDGDGRNEVLTGLAAPGKRARRLGVLSSEGRLLRTLDLPTPGVPDDFIRTWSEGDFNGDGLPEVAMFVWRTVPIVYDATIFDPRTGVVLWHRTNLREQGLGVGPEAVEAPCLGPTQPVVTALDLNGDQADELVLGSLGLNYVALDGRSGDVLEAFHVIKIFNVVSGYGYPRLADLDGDGALECIMSYSGQAGTVGAFRLDDKLPYPDRKLWVEPYNSRNGLYMTGSGHPAFGAADTDRDGKMELLVPHRGGELRCHDAMTGATRWTYRAGARPTDIMAWDIDGDGRDEFVFGGHDGQIHAVEGDGEPLWVAEAPHDLGGRVDWLIAADVLGRGKPQLVVSANGRVYVME